MMQALANAQQAAARVCARRWTKAMLTMPSEMSAMPTAICALGSSRNTMVPSTVTRRGAVPRISGYANERSPVRYACERVT